MMKRSLWSIVCLLLISSLALAACQPAAPEATEAPAQPSQPPAQASPTPEPAMTEEPMGLTGTIVLWHALTESETSGLNAIIAAFQEQNPDVEFDVLFTPFDDLRGKFETSAATGEGPSILIGADDWGPPLYQAQLVSDVSGDFDSSVTNNINQAALAEGQFQGAQVGLPYVLKGVVLYRNNSIVSDPAGSFDDLVAAATAATSGDTVGANLEDGFFFSAGHLFALGGQLMTPQGDPAFNDDNGVAWMNELLAFKDAGPVENYSDNDVNLFKANQVGFIIDGTWNLAGLADAIGADNLSVDPWPSDMSGFVQSGYVYLNANTTGDDRAASVAFMKFLMTPEAQALFLNADQAFIPSVAGVDIPDRLRQEAVAAFEGGAAFIVIPEMGAYWDPMNNAILKVVNEGADPGTALQEAFDAVTASVADIRGQ